MDLSYFAGFFDGEGSINITTRQRKHFSVEHSMSISIGQKDGATLDWIKENVGGRIYIVKRDNTYFWTASNREAERILKLLLPYLQYKKPQAETALSFYLSKKSSRKPVKSSEIERRNSIREKLKELKHVVIKSRYAGSESKRIDPIGM